LTTQWQVILANPLAFVACAVAFSGAGFGVGKLFYSTQAEIAKDRLEAARDDLARLEKDNASRAQELRFAKSEVSALRADIDRAPRIKVVSELPKSPGVDDLFIESEASAPVPSAELFLRPPSGTLEEALAKAKESQKPVFLVIYDAAHPTRSKLAFTLGYFLEYQTTRKLVDEHFEPAVVPVSDPTARALVPADDPLERPRWVVLTRNSRVLRSEGLYANPDVGLERTREAIAVADRQNVG
jgi:hypothetical protein